MPNKFITSEPLLTELAALLKRLSSKPISQAFVGFDGFIDTIQNAVKFRLPDGAVYFNTIREFSDHLATMDGKSGQVELVTNKIKMGGNAPILSNALSKLGVITRCVGSMGFPEINPLFKESNTIAEQLSVSPPGSSSAIEFGNGKIILSDLSVFKNYNWRYIKEKLDLGKLIKSLAATRLYALVDWANVAEATDIWQGFLDDVIRPAGKKDQYFLFDLCDPSKKSSEQIDEMLDLISDFSEYGKVTLGLNENEANKIWLALNGHDHVGGHDGVELPPINTVGYFIYRAMNIDTLLIHPIDRTIVFRNQKDEKKPSVIELFGHVVSKPKVQTGGGDNLNAGYCLGLLVGLEVHQCMLLGMAASGAYVKNGASSDVNDLIQYLEHWATKLKVAEAVV
jgi:hypothetical protein